MRPAYSESSNRAGWTGRDMWLEWKTVERHTGCCWEGRKVRDREADQNKDNPVPRDLEEMEINGHYTYYTHAYSDPM